jgi:hypothetical protein
MCYLSKNPSKYFSFCDTFSAHGEVVVGFTIFHIVIFQKNEKIKEKKKDTPPWYVKVGGHPKDSVSHGL